MKLPSFVACTLAVFTVANIVQAHMEVISPPPRGSHFNSLWTGPIDYDMNSPLGVDRPFPCQGKPPGAVVANITPGSFQVTLYGSVFHDFGHCQFALSYDNGITWVVLSTVVRYCMQGSLSFSIPIPSSIPSCDRCIFSWNWINAIGNREFYSNCVDVSIQGIAGGKIVGPSLFVANLPGYPIVPEFPLSGSVDYRYHLDQRPIITVTGGGTVIRPSTASTVIRPSTSPTTSSTLHSVPVSLTKSTVTVTVTVTPVCTTGCVCRNDVL